MFHSIRYWNHLPDLLALVLVVSLQVLWARRWMADATPSRKRMIQLGLGVSLAFLFWGFLAIEALPGWLPISVVSWARACTLAWGGLSLAFSTASPFLRWLRVEPAHHPARRAFLRTAQAALVGTPVAAMGYGVFIQRRDLRLREVNLTIPGLPKDLDGLKLVQLTDIHMGAFLEAPMLRHAVEIANDTRANLALVTGDLISYKGDPLDSCLDELARLRTDAGILGCMGNHEIYAGALNYVQHEGGRRGMQFLRKQARPLQFGGACLNVAGMDYQSMAQPYLVGVEKLVRPDAFNLLLSHNPDVFPVAAKKGFSLTISGHTHGGQVRVEILRQDLNVARFFTPYVDGVYKENGSSIFVSRGIGTIGMPARLGAPPGGRADPLVAYLILSDIHSNLEALEAVLADAAGRYEHILSLGDVVGYGADPNPVVEWVRENAVAGIRGNHDKACVGLVALELFNGSARIAAEWTQKELTEDNLNYLQRLPRGPLAFASEPGAEPFDMVHGSPLDEDEYLLSFNDLIPVFTELTSRITFFGHTHVQGGFLLTQDGARRLGGEGFLELEPQHFWLINPGSVGQPRDRDPRAAYALYSPETKTVEYCRVAYDVEKAAGKIRAAGLPERLAARLYEGF